MLRDPLQLWGGGGETMLSSESRDYSLSDSEVFMLVSCHVSCR